MGDQAMTAKKSAALAAALFFIFLAGSWALPLSEPDEGRYAEIAAHMARTGDWLTPHLDGIPYYEKPPLFFWLAGLSMRAFGEHELAARLPSILAATLGALIVARLGARVFARATGLVACAMVVSIPLFQLMARFAMVDPLLSLFVLAALDGFSRGLVEPAEPRRAWIVAAWTFLGAAFLVKGPVGVVLPVGAIVTWIALRRDVVAARALFAPAGLVCFAAVAAPWFFVMNDRNAGFAREFFLSQNLARFATGGRFRRTQPFWFYAPVIVGAFLPWSLFAREAFRGLREAIRSPDAAARARLFLACAVVVPFVVLSAAANKLVYYVLPLAPPYALLVASSLAGAWERGERTGRRRLLAFAIGALACAAATVALRQVGLVSIFERARGASEVSERARLELACIEDLLFPRAALAIATLGVGALAASLLTARGRALAGVGALAGAIAAVGAIAPFLARPAERLFSARGVAVLAAKHERQGEPILAYRDYPRGLPFYLGHPVVLGEAKYHEFGHDFTAADADERAIDLDGLGYQANAERLRAFVARHESVLVVGDTPQRPDDIANLTSATTEVLERENNVVIFRARRRPAR